MIVYAPSEGRAAIFEIKYSKDVESLSKDCNAALRRIDTCMYTKELENDYDQVLCYGISFFKKRCVIRKNRSRWRHTKQKGAEQYGKFNEIARRN